MTKRAIRNKIFKIIIVIIFCYYVLTGLIAFLPGPLVDFPCAARVYDGCFVGRSYKINNIGTKNIEVYLTHYRAGYSGAGCLYNASGTNEVYVEKYLFQRSGENLIINNKITLEKNMKWEEEKILHFWNPWVLEKEKISITNYGVLNCTIKNENITPYGPTLIAIGSTGTYYETNYIGILTFAFLIGLLFDIYNNKKFLK